MKRTFSALLLLTFIIATPFGHAASAQEQKASEQNVEKAQTSQAQPKGEFLAAYERMPNSMRELSQQEGVSTKYLGKVHDFDSWLFEKDRNVQYHYVLPEGKGYFIGTLFDRRGNNITMRQLMRYKTDKNAAVDELNVSAMKPAEKAKSKAEKLYADIEDTYWLSIGQKNAPYIYVFIDPDCPHCKEYFTRLSDYIETGRLAVRLIPVGGTVLAQRKAAKWMQMETPQLAFLKHLNGDRQILQPDGSENLSAVIHNINTHIKYKFNINPFTVYAAKDGKIRLIKGPAQNIQAILDDLN